MPAKNKLNVGDQAEALREDEDEGPPKRSDFGAGLAGELAYNKARTAYLAKQGGKSPKPATTEFPTMERGTEAGKSDSPNRAYNLRDTVTSSTPASDTKAKKARMSDKLKYPDSKVRQMAEDGDFDAREEADRRGVKWVRR